MDKIEKTRGLTLREIQTVIEEFIFVGQAHKLGLFRELYAKPDTPAGLALRMSFDKRAVWVLLEALAEMGYLKRDNENFSVPDEVYDRLIDEDGENYEGDFWQFLLYLVNPWRTLPHVLKHGEPDKSSYKDFSMQDFIKGMDSPWKKRIAPRVVDLCLRLCADAKVVIDIGGAPGTIARAFAARGIKTLIYDLPESLEVLGKKLSKLENIEIQSGDATKTLPAGVYDIAFLGNLCHGQSPEDNEKIIKMAYERLRDRGIIVIFDNLRGESYLGATLALHMITQSSRGNVYSRKEYIDWLEDADFKNIIVENLSDPAWQMVIGYK